MGNSEAVAGEHYLHTTDADFQRATQETTRGSTRERAEIEAEHGIVRHARNPKMQSPGISGAFTPFPTNEQETSYPTRIRNDLLNNGTGNDLQETDIVRAVQSGAVGAESRVLSIPDDPRLLGLIDAWPTLSEDVRDAIAQLVSDDSQDFDDVTLTSAGMAVS